MPTVLRIKGYRFFFFSEEGSEPLHIHIAKGDGEAKIWLEPQIKACFFSNFKVKEQSEIMNMVKSHHTLLKNKWYEFFQSK